MSRLVRVSFLASLLAGLLVGLASSASSSSVVSFSARSSWDAAVGGAPDFLIDFEDFSSDAVFGLSAVDAGPFSLTQTAGIPNLFNRVDVPPFFAVIGAGNSPNGSTFAQSVIGNSAIVGNNKVQITFDEPQIAFGADFRNNPDQVPNDFALNQLVLNSASGPTTTNISTPDGFFGFIASESFSSITFQLDPSHPEVNTSFGMDNVVAVSQLATTVEIDVKPGSGTNPINLSSRGTVPVAILSTSSFDARTVDPATVCFGDADTADQRDCTEAHGGGHIEDVNGDGRLDLLLHYETSQTGIDPGDTEACLTGETFDGSPIQGCNSVSV
jgi:hypothetical protein